MKIQTINRENQCVCISDEAHRSQSILDQKVPLTDKGTVKKSYGFAKHLHDSFLMLLMLVSQEHL